MIFYCNINRESLLYKHTVILSFQCRSELLLDILMTRRSFISEGSNRILYSIFLLSVMNLCVYVVQFLPNTHEKSRIFKKKGSSLLSQFLIKSKAKRQKDDSFPQVGDMVKGPFFVILTRSLAPDSSMMLFALSGFCAKLLTLLSLAITLLFIGITFLGWIFYSTQFDQCLYFNTNKTKKGNVCWSEWFNLLPLLKGACQKGKIQKRYFGPS